MKFCSLQKRFVLLSKSYLFQSSSSLFASNNSSILLSNLYPQYPQLTRSFSAINRNDETTKSGIVMHAGKLNHLLNASNGGNQENRPNAHQRRDPSLKPTTEQLLLLKEKLTNHLPRFLKEMHPYSIYTPDVIFENHYKEPGKVTIYYLRGALQYAIQLTILRFKVHWKFSQAQLQVLKMTHHDEDGTIKIRWRIAGVRGMKSFTQPWKIKVWKVKESISDQAEWHDGFSILYVRGDGLVYKHRLDRVMPQSDQAEEKKKKLVKSLSTIETTPTMFSNHD